MEFEKENDIMDQRQEMMDDAIDDVTGLEDEQEGEEVVNQVLDELGVELNQSVSLILVSSIQQTEGHTNSKHHSWGKLQVVYNRRLWEKAVSPRLLVEEMMISKLVSIT